MNAYALWGGMCEMVCNN